MNYPKNSRTARALYDAKKSREEAEEKMKQANEEVYGEKKEQYESLEGTISRIKR